MGGGQMPYQGWHQTDGLKCRSEHAQSVGWEDIHSKNGDNSNMLSDHARLCK